ncbi:MAG: hypothetical protein CVT48_06430 [Thermoplasmata archaeon HGW-Thermoplasmata-1]|nr:ATP-binding protein [Candidatus Methanoperedens sp.]PKK85229.1 MAG: hypothetical protein CVT48_06430 [Thermoplasmata archaeon HGW-Thermoplasmata-1]
MDIEKIKRIIREQRVELKEILGSGQMIKREIPIEGLKTSLSAPNILAIIGVRRCGKSTFSAMLGGDRNYGYLNFDDERLLGMATGDLNQVLQAFYELYGNDLDFLILDEIQNVPGWELFANRLRRTKRVILTGSNANLLSGELATHLTGRHVAFTMYPFSFKEFLKVRGIDADLYSTKSIAEIRNALQEYIKIGGFPEADILGRGIVSGIYGDIVHKDIVLRHRVRNVGALSEMANHLVSMFSREFTYKALMRISGIKSINTVRNYMGYLESSYLIFSLKRFSFKLKEQSMAPRKVYCVDTGIINSAAFKFSEDRGRMMENIVAVELLRRISYFGNGEIFYWKDHQNREVDFVVKSGNPGGSLIQVTYASTREGIEEREIKNLVRASGELGCSDLLLITWDYEGEEVVDGKKIKIIPLWKWLLE